MAINIPTFTKFETFYDHLHSKLVYYKPSVISNKFNIPANLQSNIHNYDKFINTFEKLVNDKLYIVSEMGYDQYKMFHNYILPTCVFLHYMHIDLEKLTQIHLYIVPHETYERYSLTIGGQYTAGFNRNDYSQTHLIFIKDYLDLSLNTHLIQSSLVSLFHELMHLVDNSNFNNSNDSYNISYILRCHEIKAKSVSKFFYEFYKALSESKNPSYRFWIINRTIFDLKEILMSISETIESMLFCNNELIELKSDESRDSIMKYSKQNIQYYTSLREINQINKFFNNFLINE